MLLGVQLLPETIQLVLHFPLQLFMAFPSHPLLAHIGEQKDRGQVTPAARKRRTTICRRDCICLLIIRSNKIYINQSPPFTPDHLLSLQSSSPAINKAHFISQTFLMTVITIDYY